MNIALELHIRAHFYDGQVELSSQFAEYYTLHCEINCAILLHIDINLQNCRTHTIICSKTSTFDIFFLLLCSRQACRTCDCMCISGSEFNGCRKFDSFEQFILKNRFKTYFSKGFCLLFIKFSTPFYY